MGTYTSADVLCPYYHKDIPQTNALVCEGVLPGSRYKSYFKGRADIQDHMGKYCAGDYKICPWFKVLSRVYDESDS